MIRFYSLFITDDNLLASPYVRRLNFFHDVTLQLGETETVNFLLQAPLSTEQSKQLNIICDPVSVEVIDVEAKSFRHQSLITVTLIPKEIGSVKIGLAFPQSTKQHREKMQKLPSPLISIPCQTIHQAASQQRTAPKVPGVAVVS